MEPTIATINTAVSTSLLVIDSKNLETVLAKNLYSIAKMPSDDVLIFRNNYTKRVEFKYEWGVSPDITITDGVTPVTYDGTSVGVNEFDQLREALRTIFFN